MSQQPPNGPDYEGGSQPPVPPPGDPAYGGPSGPYGPGYGGPSGPSGPYGVPPGADPIKPWPVILGVLLGAVVSWVYLAVVLFVGFARSYDASSQGEEAGIWFAGALILAVLPIIAAIVLLCIRRTRQLGAGFVMGLCIGTIIGAGVCALPWFAMFMPVA
ncbi:MAG: hypothetical protein V9G04_04955 [Nocardioides sp.]|jgi:hypothetical protein